MKIDLSQFRETFLQESAEHILDIEAGLLRLNEGQSDNETLNSIFRAAHSIKGGAGSFGLTQVVQFTHVFENLFDQMRDGKVKVSGELVTFLLRANDVLKDLLSSRDAVLSAAATEMLRQLEAASLQAGAKAVESATMNSAIPMTDASGPLKQEDGTEYLISFRPAPDLFATGTDPALLLRNLSGLGKVFSSKLDYSQLPRLTELRVSTCYLSWQIEVKTLAPRDEIDEIFEFVLDCAAVRIEERSAAAAQAFKHAEHAEPKTQSLHLHLAKDGVKQQTGSRGEAGASIRIATDKIDRLIDTVGEMVIAHSITARLVEGLTDETSSALQESVANLDRHIRELHEQAISVRMLPIGSLFSRFNRLIHDLAEKTGKQMKLITEGDETEVDRSILELLGDPLTHILRNSADHGIESSDLRVKAGKSPEGRILLRASHQAGTILIEVIDDGAGLNLGRIRQKAISRNLMRDGAKLTDEQLRLLIFEAGFSTKDEVNDLSGRGVGMDVVKRNVSELNGHITLDSKEGFGTHLRIYLPITLAIIEGLIVRVGIHSFVIPLTSIVETVCLSKQWIYSVAGQGEIAQIRDQAIPFVSLKKVFGLNNLPEEIESSLGDRVLIAVVQQNEQRVALQIDELLGQQQIVVKSIERNFEKLEGTLGATILGDGRTALILDAQALITRRSKTHSADRKTRFSLVA